jgi:adenosylcobinamide-GDP ribazoletransferase
MTNPLMSFCEAIRFLTLIPIPFLLPKDQSDYERNIAGAMRWFPLVGALIGGLAALTAWMAGLFFDATVRALLAVIVIAVVTSGLHLDGLADTFDAVMSWRSRERKLEIMKDSRIGAMGALALLAVLPLKVALLAQAGTPLPALSAALIAAPAIGRWVDLYGIYAFPAAAAGGLGANYRAHTRMRDFGFATLTLLGLCGVLFAWTGDAQLFARLMLAALLAFVTAHVIFTRWTRSLGGLTGDTYGALCEIAEVVVIAVMVAKAPIH